MDTLNLTIEQVKNHINTQMTVYQFIVQDEPNNKDYTLNTSNMVAVPIIPKLKLTPFSTTDYFFINYEVGIVSDSPIYTIGSTLSILTPYTVIIPNIGTSEGLFISSSIKIVYLTSNDRTFECYDFMGVYGNIP